MTGAHLKFPILEQGSNIQRAFSVRLARLKRVLDSGLSALMDAHFESQRNGWGFAVRHPSAAVRRVVELAGVGQVLGDA